MNVRRKTRAYTLIEVIIFIIWVLVVAAIIAGVIVAWHFISKAW